MVNINLKHFTRSSWHNFYKSYTFDPLMDDEPYIYDEEKVSKNYDVKMNDTSREYFAILNDDQIIGQIYLKNINLENKTAEIGIALINHSVKNNGFGTMAIKLLLDYAFNHLKLVSIYADTVVRNTRSQHVLEKCGFTKYKEDTTFIYYKIERNRI